MRLCCLWLAATLLSAQAVAGDEDKVSIAVANETRQVLRCQFLLAHWMTSAAVLIQPGASARLALGRAVDGALFQRQAGEERPFHVESLLCGSDRDFGSSRIDLDLSPLRARESDSLSFRCGGEAAPACRRAGL